jgi:hypothetical protein
VPRTQWKVYTSYFENHMKFFVQKIAEHEALQELLNKLMKVSSETLEKPSIGQIILAR